MLNPLMADFEAGNPDIKVKFIHIQQNFNTVLLTMMAGGRAPDIFYVAPVTLGNMLSKGVLLNLEPYLEKSQLVWR